jgi:hypothetical protein
MYSLHPSEQLHTMEAVVTRWRVDSTPLNTQELEKSICLANSYYGGCNSLPAGRPGTKSELDSPFLSKMNPCTLSVMQKIAATLEKTVFFSWSWR